MFRYAIKIEYDGTAYHGWQRQSSIMTVQGELDSAIKKLEPLNKGITGAGRTDTGVHALAQVGHLDLSKEWNPQVLQNALNFHLKPNLISVISATLTSSDFHARFSAINRYYIFKILIRRAPLTLNRNRYWHLKRSLAIDEMQKAANHLIGTHDFTTFRSAMCQSKSPVKTIDDISIKERKISLGSIIEIRINAKSFLHNQVRSISGTLERVGSKVWSSERVVEALEAKDRKECGPVAPAHGLYLEKILYSEKVFFD